MPSDYWKRAVAIQKEYLKKLEAHDTQTLNLLTSKYSNLMGSLETVILDLANIKNKTPSQIIQLEAYKEFIRDLNKQHTKFVVYADNLITAKQGTYIQLGLSGTQETIGLVGVRFNKLNPNALKWILGNSIQGGRLEKLLSASYPDSVARITDTIIQSVAIGRNPRETARLIKVDMSGNLSRALRISRTESLGAYREASREQMKESKLVEEYEWLSETDACDFCLENNGKRFPVDEIFETHPNCRCSPVPLIGQT